MASFSLSSVGKGSDSFTDFCCSPCLEHKIDQWAEFYCDNCLKFYCVKCINLHGQLFGKHVTYGRGETSKWPVSKEVEDFIQKCDLHEDKLLEMFCNDHNQLCCTNCAFVNHRHCAKVVLISESVKGPLPDLQQLSRNIQTVLEDLEKLQNYWDTNMQSLQVSYNKQLNEIRDTRQKINTILDKIEQNTIKELEDKMASLKASVQTNVDHCSKLQNELKRLSNTIHDIVYKGKAELSFIASKKCVEKINQSETYLTDNLVQVESSLTFQADSDCQQHLSKLSGLGRIVECTQSVPLPVASNKVLTVQGKAEYNVRIPSDSQNSFNIFAICVLSNGEILLADYCNKRVKLLDHQYQVVGHCDFTAYPEDMCPITSSEVAVAVDVYNMTHEVQFVSVNDGQLVKGRKLQFQHRCKGIANHLQDLYLTSSTALYKYSMSGDLLRKLYEDKSGGSTVNKCAVSPSGDKILVTNLSHSKVLTLDRDGTVLHTFTDRDLESPEGIHMTALGQVLVCGGSSNTVLQLDGEGKKKLATLATGSEVLDQPMSVCYNRNTASIIVAQPPVLHLSSQVTQITELYRHRVTLNEAASSMLKCNTCNLTFREPLDLEKHRQLHLDRRVYKCCICQYTFSDLYNFRCHLRIHDKIATYTCDMCPFMVFGERKQYISHLEDHELAKDSYIPGHTLRLPCFVCKKDFPDRASLRKHQNYYHSEKCFKCALCGKAFVERAKLQRHQITHTGKKEFQCTYCDKSFGLKHNLLAHMNIHTKYKPWECSICRRKFGQKVCLNRHLKVHEGFSVEYL
ncbi:uncharacterized protein LOC127847745 isoform X3 [Dreissena polymorpha]|uniref:uncharacterized protein LOC127847745 isoform X3 n=1 Tax=Dreissena polymorpha TaxID=45954 RepID=UPI0022655E4B|nr:uncharacterized protein LOC127847745 isoform X3 [Dreissena polymorpha]